MHNNYYLFKQLVPQLDKELKGAVFIEAFSQNKDELILSFRKSDATFFYIKAYLKSHFSCLSFPQNFKRAKKNSASIFQELEGLEVANIYIFKNERAFIAYFSNTYSLLFKLHGNRSNIILLEDTKPKELFKNSLKNDLNIDIKELDKTLYISYDNMVANEWNIRKVWPTLDKRSTEHLLEALQKEDEPNKAITFNTFLQKLESPDGYYVISDDKGYRLSLLRPLKDDFEQFDNPLVAITAFFNRQVKHQSISTSKEKIRSGLNSKLVKAGNYIIKSKQKLQQLIHGVSNKQIADVLMANLHNIKKGAKKAELFNFYTNETLIVKLNPLLSAQKNAERYYRKAKNEAKEIAILEQNIAEKEKQVEQLNQDLKAIEEADNLKELKKWQSEEVLIKQDTPLPYKEFSIDEYKVLVGKNAKQNDVLTLKLAKKEDLWLHAKDVAGSHVVIKQIPGKNYPKYIIEKAAQLAAHYSKRKTDTLCPVIYTPKKYVRKPKGAPAGAVVVEKEKVLLVEPSPNP